MMPENKLQYMQPTAWKGGPPTLAKHTWSMNLIVAWNAAAREHLHANSPDWLSNLRGAMRASPPSQMNTPAEQPDTSLVLPSKFLHKKDDAQAYKLTLDAASEQWLSETSHLELKCPDWKEWTYTDGSRIKQTIDGQEMQFIGAGVYHPATQKECYANPGGKGVMMMMMRLQRPS